MQYLCPICKKSASITSWNDRTMQIASVEGRYGYDSKTGFPKDFEKMGESSQNKGNFSCPNCYRSEIEGERIVRVTE